MSKRRPTDAQLAEMLTQPHFGQRREIAPQDPITTTPMIVEIDRIDYYDRNPRRSPNDKYQEIKASIAAGEMDQPLTITRRPGAPRYMVFKGGNTRLRALKELCVETGEERFQRIHCLFQPWTRESDALLGHLKENDLRGDLVFIDRALAIRELRGLIEDEMGERLSSRTLSAALKERGYTIGHAIIDWFNYAVDVLHQAIPTALKAGMGRPQIERIKALDRSFGQCWKSLDLGADDIGQSVFVEVLSRHDADQLDLDSVRRDLETELSVTADIDVQRASLLMGAALDGRALSEEPAAAHRSGDDGRPHEQELEPATSELPRAAGTGAGQPAAPTQPSGKPATKAGTELPQEISARKGRSGEPGEEEAPAALTLGRAAQAATEAEDLPALRERAVKLARDIAVLARMGDQIIHPIPDGVGYLIGPTSLIPSDNLISVSDEHVRHLVYLWWTLAQISEQFADGSRAGDHLPAEWRDTPIDEAIQHAGNWEFFQWHAFIEEERAPVVWDLIPMATLPGFGPLLWPKMHDWAWEMFVELVGVYRSIHKAANGKVWG
ncbi:ParB family protein [Sulfurivermis fontis]|uniref:ParB family protein n=1 Tax=Sulfurivermis fontis TaxID=1972068 RepID=UPI001559864B|nr:ParB family protein [Sulfurivermis fontis]